MNNLIIAWNSMFCVYVCFWVLKVTGFVRVTERTEYGPLIKNADGSEEQKSKGYTRVELAWPWSKK